jgi:hypothetical protein
VKPAESGSDLAPRIADATIVGAQIDNRKSDVTPTIYFSSRSGEMCAFLGRLIGA